jgi:hypothetical protein
MLLEFSPELIAGEIKITRALPRGRPAPDDRREAA